MASEKIFGLPGAPLSPESLQTGRTVVCEFLDGHRRAEIIGQRPLWNKATEKNPAGYYVRVRFVDKQWGICNVCLDTMHVILKICVLTTTSEAYNFISFVRNIVIICKSDVMS